MNPVTPDTAFSVDGSGPLSGWVAIAATGSSAGELAADLINQIESIDPLASILERELQGSGNSSTLLHTSAWVTEDFPVSGLQAGSAQVQAFTAASRDSLRLQVAYAIQAQADFVTANGGLFRNVIDTAITNAGAVFAAVLLSWYQPPA